MKKRKLRGLFLAVSLLAVLAGCAPPGEKEESPSPTPESVSSAPAQSAGPTLTVEEEALPAALFESSLGYTLLYPEEKVAVREWDGGETFEVTAAPGTYLAVSVLDVPNIDQAVSVVQFENAVEDEPRGILFGSGGYAGTRLTHQSGELSTEYLLFQMDGGVCLVERSLFGAAGQAQGPLLQAMLDSFTLCPGEA